jgi:hypothetical protein
MSNRALHRLQNLAHTPTHMLPEQTWRAPHKILSNVPSHEYYTSCYIAFKSYVQSFECPILEALRFLYRLHSETDVEEALVPTFQSQGRGFGPRSQLIPTDRSVP